MLPQITVLIVLLRYYEIVPTGTSKKKMCYDTEQTIL